MDQRKRLIELLRSAPRTDTVYGDIKLTEPAQTLQTIADHLLANGVVVIDTDAVSVKNRPLISQCFGYPLDEIIDLIRAKEEGRVIAPPCKVGDTVYVVSQGAGFSVVWNVYKAIAKAIHLDQYGQLFIRVETDKENIGGYVEIERVFLTKEEAQKALAERNRL